ncbi:MAG: hypothetical protein WBM02_05910 [bacterium]
MSMLDWKTAGNTVIRKHNQETDEFQTEISAVRTAIEEPTDLLSLMALLDRPHCKSKKGTFE